MLTRLHCIALIVAAATIEQAIGSKAMYERFEQFFGEEYIELDLRVRKYNRTMMTLNGTIYVKQDLNDSLVFSSDVFHSRLGNQQFQHYPMHLPTSGFCEFIKNVHESYATVIADIVNIPMTDDCPVSQRNMLVQDEEFKTEVLPESMAYGLWKMVISGVLNEETVIRFMVSIRLSDNYM
ncbi:uncharacterized protein LOC128723872 [Anopheles nili]|uniref:uncharacterized protein LOC128723872 n=1 Tax=Anopheles nili TaxID=185578 RepID=UPI00237A38D3|nr:uncharacterized protein LOC128723872 [Anopheles nili]